MSEISYSKIKIYAVVYEKDTNGNYVTDSNGDRIILKPFNEVKISDKFDIVTEISEQYGTINDA